MKTVKKQVWLAASAAVIAGNLYLIFKEDSRAMRTEWLTDWDRAATGDIVKSFSAEGVIVPSDEYPIYFDSRKGALEQIFVHEGDPVGPGTSLFQYASEDIDEEIDRLTAEKEETEQQIQLIDNQLSQLRTLLSQAESNESGLSSPFSDDDNQTTIIQSGDASTSVESDILQQEMEKQKLQEAVKKYTTLIEAQEAKKDGLIVRSTSEGYVKKVDTSLNNPIIVINSSVPAVEGVFDEKQLAKAAAGQRVEVTVDTTLKQFDGVVEEISTYPEEAPSVKRKSLYPFSAQLTGVQPSELFPGLKANVKVVTEEQKEAVTIPGHAILKTNKKTYAVIMNDRGQLERRKIETGLYADGVYQVVNGVEAGESIVIDPYELTMTRGPFITPIVTDNVKRKPWTELSRTEKIKYALMGFLS